MSIGFWFDTDEINAQAEKELKEEHFRRLVNERKKRLERDERPWWVRLIMLFPR